MSGRIEFTDVGRDKRAWSAPLTANPLDTDAIEAAVEKMVRKSGALMSRSIAAYVSDDGETGVIVVGGMRTVGSFRIVDGADAEVPQ